MISQLKIKSNTSRTNITVRKRMVFMLMVVFLVQTIILGRYAWIQTVWSPELQRLAVEQWTNDGRIDAIRGTILDTNNRPLAVSGNVYRVSAFMKEINATANHKDPKKQMNKEVMAEKIAEILNVDKSEILNKLNKKNSKGLPIASVDIARRIEKEQAEKIQALKISGLSVYPDTKRYYPSGNFLSQVLGNLNIDGDGRAGLELVYNKLLKGMPGRVLSETDRFLRESPNSIVKYVAPKPGSDLVLTIDQSIQYFAEKAIEKGMVDYKAKQISVLIMDVTTGGIVAMANKPDYDPNNPVIGDVTESMALWKNRLVNDSFEPGSILKIVTMAAALEENAVDENEKFNCHGSYIVAGRKIKCHKTSGHGIQTLTQILENSCNVGFMILGEKLQKERLYKYFNAFGFGKKTNIDYPGEQVGILPNIKRIGPVELANQAFGQGISVTPIQYLTALSAVANDGKMMQPHLVKEIIHKDSDGNTSEVEKIESKVVKQVISKETANKLVEMLESVVTNGAGRKAYIEGYHIGGKTGTAQKVIDGKYAPGKYISSFASIAPSTNPKYAMIVSIDEPDPSNYYSGSTAAPIAKQIYEDMFRYLNIEPDMSGSNGSINKVTVPEVRGMSQADGEKLLKNLKLNIEIKGTGSIINDISPKPGVSVAEKTKVIIQLGNDNNTEAKVAVPNFNRKTRKEIETEATSLGLKISFVGDGIGASQDIPEGTIVDKGKTIKVILEHPED